MANDKLTKIEYFVKKPAKGIHSEAHALTKELSEYCGEPKKFAMYLGIIKNIGLKNAYKIFAEIRQAEKVDNKGKLFLYLSSKKAKKKTLIKSPGRDYEGRKDKSANA
jgi:hypothetical protein